ncbi:hypothetical protein HanLR1_Chr10g0369441 [Helianthus annuus]|nr:hypothetical protein HanHA89_Chr10g0392031 [Helianthus annuus]KAJ0697486.1 hypothetical protein HanLR1_Chr10g0369441 [Helianthus annuus]
MKALLHSVPFEKMKALNLFAVVIPVWESSYHLNSMAPLMCGNIIIQVSISINI